MVPGKVRTYRCSDAGVKHLPRRSSVASMTPAIPLVSHTNPENGRAMLQFSGGRHEAVTDVAACLRPACAAPASFDRGPPLCIWSLHVLARDCPRDGPSYDSF